MAQAILQPSQIKEENTLPEPYHPKSSIFNNIFKIGKFNEERNPIDASLSICGKYLLPLLILSNSLPFNEHNSYLLTMQQLLNYSIIYYPLIIFNKFLIVVTLVALYQQIFLLSSLAQQIIKIFRSKLRLLIEIDFHISMLLLSLSILPNLPNAILSLALHNFSCIYLENYINKDDYFYCSSCKASFVGRLLMAVGYILNALINAGANKSLLEIFILLLTACMVVWYHQFGYKLYPHRLVKRGMTGFISLLITANLLIIEKNFVGGSTEMVAFIIRATLSFGLISLCLSQFSNIKSQSSQQNTTLMDIKDILNHLFVNQSSLEEVIFIYGQIQMHRDRCQNLHCELHSFNLFNQKISLHEEQWGIRNILKGYFRCLYQSKMVKQDRHSELLDYLQYLYSENNSNPFKMSLILSQINLSYLDIFDRASLYDLKSSVEKLFKNQMKELYDGKLHFEENISFDSNCQSLQQMIAYLVKSNITIYQHLEQSEIDLNIVFQRIRENLSVEKDLHKCWGKISRNMQYHRSISVIYLYYKQLIKNERITRKDLLFMQPEKNILDEQIHLFNSKAYDSSILFHKETIIFTCYLHEKRLLFKDFNFNFQNILQYSKEELASASIDNILTEQLTKVHQDSFQSWLHGNLQSTYFNAQFEIKDTECLTKDKRIIPVIKYFKAYLSSDSDLEFICLLKINKKSISAAENMDYLQAALSKPLKLLEEEQNEPEMSFLYHTSDMQLSNEHAIFTKEKEFEPNSQSRDILQFKTIIFAFCFFIAISLVAFHQVTVNDSAILQEYTKQYITFMQCYRIPMILGNNYLQSIMQVGNQTKIAAQITQLSTAFTALQSSSIVVETLFSPSINVPNNYSPYSADYFIANRSLQFDSIQLFYMISSSVSSLRAPVNKSSLDFLTFDQLITPSYDNLINGTKHKFHESFIDYISHITSMHLIIEVIQIVLCALFFSLMMYKICAFMKKMKLISDAIVYFKNEDLENILNYWRNSRLIFKELFRNFKNEPAGNIPRMKNKTLNKEGQKVEQYMNRITKNIRESKHFKNFKTITVLEVLIGTLLLLGCLSGTEFSRTDKFNNLIYFERQGYLFLQYFPTATITGYGCLSKYRSVHFPNETTFDYSRFNPSLEAMELVGKFSYIPQVQQNDSQYFQKQRNYFFGNPCIFNPNVIYAIGVNITTCETIMEGSFTRGLTSYMRVGSQRARGYMSGGKDMNSSQLGEFSTSVSVLSAYILDAITTWGTQFNNILNKLIQQQAILTIVNFAVLGAIVLIIFIILFIGFLEHEYQFYRYMFMKMIPEYILKADKVARQTFINFNILE